MSKIDFDRGVMIRKHNATGTSVFMYFDQPGQYMNAHGGPVSEALAEQAGFDIAFYGKRAEKIRKMAEAERAIEAELALDADAPEVIIVQHEGYKVIALPANMARVVAEDGDALHPTPLSVEAAVELFYHLVPGAVEAEGETKTKTSQKGASNGRSS